MDELGTTLNSSEIGEYFGPAFLKHNSDDLCIVTLSSNGMQ